MSKWNGWSGGWTTSFWSPGAQEGIWKEVLSVPTNRKVIVTVMDL